MGRMKTCPRTEIDTQAGKNESGATTSPPRRAIPSGKAFPAEAAREATKGPRKTVPIVVLKAELAQSYIAQPKISRLSLTVVSAGVSTAAIVPPSHQAYY